jgi:hypothetical protein
MTATDEVEVDVEPINEVEADVKAWIDNAGYTSLLHRWRFAPVGDRFMRGKNGDYFANVMRERGEELSHDEKVLASKQVGWGT